jgi:hypothetical protein
MKLKMPGAKFFFSLVPSSFNLLFHAAACCNIAPPPLPKTAPGSAPV